MDWSLVDKHADVHRFVRLLIQRRLLRQTGPERERKSLNQLIQEAKKAWHGVQLNQPDWSDSSHSLAFSGEIRKEKLLFYLILNAYREPLDFELPPADNKSREPWRRWIDTTLDAPQDIVEWENPSPVSGEAYRAGPRSVVVLILPGKDMNQPS